MSLVVLLNLSQDGNGFLVFVLGLLFILTAYHFLLYFQQKDTSYLLYASYTSILFLAYFTYAEAEFLNPITTPVQLFFNITHQFWVWLYNIIYFVFILQFLKFKTYFPKQYKILTTALSVLFVLGFCLFVHSIYTYSPKLLNTIYETVFTKVIIVLTLWGFYLALRVKEPTKHFILLGCFFLFIGSLCAILIIDFKLLTPNTSIAFLIFYVSIILENLCFSLGLGLKQKLIAEAKNTAQNLLINQLQENDTLKEEVNQQLNAKIEALHMQLNLKKEIENQKIIALKSQMNPHFIFNALNSINLFIKKNDAKKASKYLNDFAKIIRKTLEYSSEDTISLSEELTLAKLYFSIENVRFSNTIAFSITVEDGIDVNNIKIPPLILQPFIENAIWHGLSLQKGDKSLHIDVMLQSNAILTINIVDNGIGRLASKAIQKHKVLQKQSLGIKITEERLQRFHEKSTLKFIDVNNANNTISGTKVILSLPICL